MQTTSHHRVGLAKGVGSIHARKVRLPQFSRTGLWCPQFGSQAASFDASAGSAGSGGTTIAPILAFGVSCKTNACSDAVPVAVSFCASATAADRPRIDDALMTARQQSANHAGPHPTNPTMPRCISLRRWPTRDVAAYTTTRAAPAVKSPSNSRPHIARDSLRPSVRSPTQRRRLRSLPHRRGRQSGVSWAGIGQIRRHPGSALERTVRPFEHADSCRRKPTRGEAPSFSHARWKLGPVGSVFH